MKRTWSVVLLFGWFGILGVFLFVIDTTRGRLADGESTVITALLASVVLLTVSLVSSLLLPGRPRRIIVSTVGIIGFLANVIGVFLVSEGWIVVLFLVVNGLVLAGWLFGEFGPDEEIPEG